MAVGCLAERYGAELAASLPEADAVLGFDDYPDIAARLRGILAGETHQAHVPQDRRTLLPITPVEREQVRETAHVSRAGARAREPAAPAREGPDGPAQAGQRLRPALHVLRDPELPRLLRQPTPGRGAGRGALAGGRGRPRAVPGQRELHVLRQGPRRPAPAGDPAARAGRRRRRRAGARLLPPARRDAAGAGRGDRRHARRGGVLRPLLPARQRARAAPDAPVRRRRQLPRSPRAGP